MFTEVASIDWPRPVWHPKKRMYMDYLGGKVYEQSRFPAETRYGVEMKIRGSSYPRRISRMDGNTRRDDQLSTECVDYSGAPTVAAETSLHSATWFKVHHFQAHSPSGGTLVSAPVAFDPFTIITSSA